jgi:hypothetical protein
VQLHCTYLLAFPLRQKGPFSAIFSTHSPIFGDIGNKI